MRNKSALPSAIQVKNRGKAIDTEEKLDVRSQLEKDERTVDILIMLGLLIVSTCTICDNAERIKGSAKTVTKVCV